MTGHFLVFDAGTGAGRALVINQQGETKSCAYSEWTAKEERGLPGGFTLDPQEIEDTLIDAGIRAIEESGLNPKEIKAIISTSIREGVVFLDKKGDVIYMGPNFDERALREGETMAREYGKRIYKTTGTYPPAYGYAARVKWFKDHRPREYAKIDKILTLGDWITWKLCRVLVAEKSLASASGIFDIKSQEWSTALAEDLDIDNDWLPPVYNAGKRVGTLRKKVGKCLGLSADTAIFVGGGDTQCSMLGMGLIQPMQIGCVAGTTSPIQLLTGKPIFDPFMRTWINCHLVPDIWCLESNAIVTGLAYRWVRNSFCRGMGYDEMDSLISKTPIGSHGVMAFVGAEIMDMAHYRATWDGGFFFPVPNADVQTSDFVRSVVESNAYAVKGNVEQITEISNIPVKELHVSGGQTASLIGMQILADVLGMGLKVHSQQSSSIGAAICAAVGLGIYSTPQEAVTYMVANPSSLEPNDENNERYTELYDLWRNKYKQIRKPPS
jgi:autoinducer 2 (AI-2) kinase